MREQRSMHQQMDTLGLLFFFSSKHIEPKQKTFSFQHFFNTLPYVKPIIRNLLKSVKTMKKCLTNLFLKKLNKDFKVC